MKNIKKAINITTIHTVFTIVLLVAVCILLFPKLTKDSLKNLTLFNSEKTDLEEVNVTETPQLTTEAEVTPAIAQPSERALRAAATIIVYSSDSTIQSAKEKHGNKDMSDADLVRLLATKMDSDPALLAHAEATINKSMSKNSSNSSSSQIINNAEPSTSSFFDEYEQKRRVECQNEWTKYNSCLAEYNAEVAEYNICLSEPHSSKYYCGFEPNNSCFKPFCRL